MKHRSITRGTLFLLVMLGLSLPALAAQDLAQCRKLESEFDYRRMVTDCAVAAAAPTLSPADAIELYRMLGFAHIALGEADAAEVWFLRVLVLEPEHALPGEVSPKFRQAFDDAKRVFVERGALRVTHTAPPVPSEMTPDDPPLRLLFDVHDELGRVAGAAVVVSVVGQTPPLTTTRALERVPSDNVGSTRFVGDLPDPRRDAGGPAGTYELEYRLVLSRSDGAPLAAEPPMEPVTLPLTLATAGADPLWIAVGASAVGALLVAGGSAVGVALYCNAGNCTSRPLARPVGWVNISVAGSTP